MFRLVVKKGVTWRDVIIALSDLGLKSVVADVSSRYEISLSSLCINVNSDNATKPVSMIVLSIVSQMLVVTIAFSSGSPDCTSCYCSLVPRPSLSLSSTITILEAGKKELVKQEEGLVKLIT